MAKKLAQRKLYLPSIIFVNSAILLLNALFVPVKFKIVIIGCVEIVTFGLVYLIPVKNKIRFDVFILLTTLSQWFLSSVFVLGYCHFLQKTVCKPANLELTITLNAVLPIYVLIILWIFYRAPAIVRKVRSKK